jgi:GT2 family glycosyltransferase
MSQENTAVVVHQGDAPSRIIRPEVKGRFIFTGKNKFFVKGVTYGPFGPDSSGRDYHDHAWVQRDFALMASSGINAVRTYTVPPRWLLDTALKYGLRVMIGLSWEQHVTFLDDPKLANDIIDRVRSQVRACAAHPAILCYAVGNEIPASIVRWHGAAKIEQFLRKLYRAGKAEDPTALFTYVNYPTTEYLQLPFLDLVSFNVYLHSTDSLAAYLARLLNLTGDRPLLIAEIGLDSRRNGHFAQARALEQQIQTISSAGCVGTFVFAWTDEWHRGGFQIEDWDFGLTRRDREPKPALGTVAKAFTTDAADPGIRWPRISVVLCSYNGERYIAETLSALQHLAYTDYETIVVDDGSTDATAEIAARYPVQLIRTENCGLSAARNTGLRSATGEIVAFIDDDAYPDSDWLKSLASAFLDGSYVGVGGPNIPPSNDSLVAQCVAHAPGGPIHVLLSDREAEHIPGCNMAFRKAELIEIGGFDPQFRAAGDDVDVCWRVQEQGWKLGFCATATVFHHRRDTLRAYWKQQVGYGKAEAILERKWPDKYNAAGYLTWSGRIYNAKGVTPLWWRRGRIYQGTWGAAPYQGLYHPAANLFGELPLLPEWYLLIGFLATLSLVGIVWKPLLIAISILAVTVGLSLVQAAANSLTATASIAGATEHLKAFGISMVLHLIQPVARLCGRFKYGLHPFRHGGTSPQVMPRTKTVSIWSEVWQKPEDWLGLLQSKLRSEGAAAIAGGSYDDWDLEVQGGMLAAVRTRLAVEEHGAGRQMLRFRLWPRCSTSGFSIVVLIACIAAAAAYDHSWTAAAIFFSITFILSGRMFYECALAMHKLMNVLKDFGNINKTGEMSVAKPMVRAMARHS